MITMQASYCLRSNKDEPIEDDHHHHQQQQQLQQVAHSLDTFDARVEPPHYWEFQSNVFEGFAMALTNISLNAVEYFLHLQFFDESTEHKSIHQEQDIIINTPNKNNGKKNSSRKWRNIETLRRLTRVHSLVYIFAFAWCLLIIFHQYSYDIDHIKYTKFKAMFVDDGGGSSFKDNNKSAELLQRLEHNLNQSRSRLKGIGTPFMEAHFFIGCIYIFALIFSLVTFFQGLLVFAMNRPTSFPIGRIGTDPMRESRSLANLINRQLTDFQTSSRQFDRATLGWLAANMKYLSSQRTSVVRCCDSINDNQMILEHLRQMAAENHRTHTFDPLSWNHAYVLRLLPRLFGLSMLLLIIYALVVMSGIGYFLAGIISFNQTPWTDCLTLVSFGIILIYTALPVSFICAAFLGNSVEQLSYLKGLINLIRNTIAKNERILAQIHTSNTITITNYKNRSDQTSALHKERTRINLNLLLCIIHFKLFVEIFRNSAPLSSLILLDATCLFYLLPILVRLSVPYVDMSGARVFWISLCLATVFFYDCLLLPACYFHSKSLRLYKSLNSLQAHSMAPSIIKGNRSQPTIYNEHLVSLLRKELSHPDRLIKRFAHRLAGFSFTYSTFIKVHFWFGLIVISFLSTFDTTKENTFLSGFLRDPFNLIIKQP